MFRFIIPYISPFFLFVILWVFFSQRHGIWWALGLSLLLILLSNRSVSREYFFKKKLLWLNLLIVFCAQFSLLILLTSDGARILFALLIAISWSMEWWLLKKYFDTLKDINNQDFLALNRFFYYFGFWSLVTSLYSVTIFLLFPLYWSAIIIAAVAFLWSWDLLRDESNKWSSIFYTIYLVVLAAGAIYLMPVSFYVSGALLTIWYFFLIDSTLNKWQHFKVYLFTFLIAFTLLLITSIL